MIVRLARGWRAGARVMGWALGAAALAVGSLSAQGTPTRVMIRAVAHDAKIIGSSVGGARITVVDARMGSILAQGVQEGGTGDTQKLMIQPRVRGESIYDTDGAAGFLAVLNLKRPTQVRIEAEAPLGTSQATQRVSRTMYLIPGVDVLGEGVILELYGLTVEIQAPTENPKDRAGQKIPVQARVTMLCGCPIEPGGTWDANGYEVEARIVGPDGEVLERAAMKFAGETSIFAGEILVPSQESGRSTDAEEGIGLSLEVLAMDAEKANFGVARFRFAELGTGQSSE